MIKTLMKLAVVLALVGGATGWFLTAPNTLSASQIAALPDGNAENGAQIFWAGGCASCHSAPKASGDAKLVMTGGHALKTPFGTFVTPNISPDKEKGIGGWSREQFANAMWRGVSPSGQHYYPAFPYATYTRMTAQDMSDLWAFMQTLPASDNQAADHDLGFPFNIRRGLGLWKLLFVSTDPVVAIKSGDTQLARGRYLVEALAHCGECHTPRNPIGGPDTSRWMAGGPAPEGTGKIPNISPHEDGIGNWSAQDIVYSLETGFTPEFDSFGSSMADVQLNMAKLPKSDLEAIAAYLKAIKAQPKAN